MSTKAELEARIAELGHELLDTRERANLAELRADNSDMTEREAQDEKTYLEGWQACAREFMDKVNVVNATPDGGNVMVGK